MRYPSFDCRCSFDILNHPHLSDSLLMLILLLWINVLSFRSHRKTTFSTLSLSPVCHVTAKVNVITHASTLRLLQPEEKPFSSLDVWYTAFSCMIFPSGPLVHSYFLAFLPSLVTCFSPYPSSRIVMGNNTIPAESASSHRHRHLVTYLDRISYICEACHVLRACRPRNNTATYGWAGM